jgi:GH35 family endo-1,4-beta-xylanase
MPRRRFIRRLSTGAAACALLPSLARAASAPNAGGEEWRDLDRGPESYDSAASAAALRAARARIREVRMRDWSLRFVDSSGRPRSGLEVEVFLTRHDFPFGDQVWPLDAWARDGKWDGERARAWRRRFTEMFNAANNLCYWTERPRHDASKTEERQGEPRVENFARTVEWSLAHGMVAKGHPLFWSIPKAVPDWVRRYDHATAWKFAEVRVRSLVARFRGRVSMWDAINEPMWEAAFKNLGLRQWPHIEPIANILEYIAPVLRWCREEDPEARFLLNDYGMEIDYPEPLTGNDGSRVTAASQRRRYRELIAALQDAGTPPDGVGLQSHTGWMDHDYQGRLYEEFALTGLPVHVTEFWADTKALQASGRHTPEEIEAIQADYIANYLTCAFAHPAVASFFFWGFMGTAIAWHDDRSGHDLKPAWSRVHDLIHKEWTTRETLTTDADGVVRFRGFYGDHVARLRWSEREPAQRGHRFAIARGNQPMVEIAV